MLIRLLRTLGAPLAAVTLAWLSLAPLSRAAEPVLLEAGQAPQSPLRLQATAGQAQDVELTTRMHMRMDMMGMPIEMALPTMIMDLRTQVTGVAGGQITYTWEITGARLGDDAAQSDPDVVREMQTEIAKSVGFAGTSTIDSRGNQRSGQLTASPPGADPETYAQMQKNLQQASAPVPVEAVGVGARWQVQDRLEEQGTTILQTSTYTLREHSGNAVVLDVAVVQALPPEGSASQVLPDGSSMQVTELTSTGHGTIRMDLGKILPAQSDMSLVMHMASTGGAPEVPMAMAMDMNLDVHMAPAE